jgi:uncharacterized membrane protein
MERMLVAIFEDESRARKASDALQHMGDDGVIAVHTVRIFSRQRDGAITSENIYDALPEGTMGATAVGSLLGLLGGPIGLAVGAAGGMLIGATADYAKSRVTKDFAQQVADELTVGRTAIVAEVDEESTDSVDGRLHELGATIFRRDLSDVADSDYELEATRVKANLAQAKAKLTDRTARLHAKADSVIAKLEKKVARD